jgi:AcrR family transcriptional regulator
MPKIIPDIRNRILDSARTQICESGYTGLSLRGVAEDCGIAIGTTYNYFPSKADLAVAVMENDHAEAMNELSEICNTAESLPDAICSIYTVIQNFSSRYRQILSFSYESSTNSENMQSWHEKLIGSLTEHLLQVTDRFGVHETESFARLLAESILYGAIHHHPLEDIRMLVKRLYPDF